MKVDLNLLILLLLDLELEWWNKNNDAWVEIESNLNVDTVLGWFCNANVPVSLVKYRRL